MKAIPEFRVSQIDRSLRKFSDYSQDLMYSDTSTFEDRLKFLMRYCTEDPIFSVIHSQLTRGDDSIFEDWLIERKKTVKGTIGSGELIFPQEEDTRIATMYWLLRKISRDELEVVNFAHEFYSSASNNSDDYIRFFTDTVLAPLKRDLEYRFEEMMEVLPSDPDKSIPLTSIQIIHKATNVIQQNAYGSDIQQYAEIEAQTEINQLFKQLRCEVENVVQNEDERHESINIINEAEDLVKLNPPRISTVQRLLSLLPPIGNISSITGAIIGFLSL